MVAPVSIFDSASVPAPDALFAMAKVPADWAFPSANYTATGPSANQFGGCDALAVSGALVKFGGWFRRRSNSAVTLSIR
jgi:hypothetical protein